MPRIKTIPNTQGLYGITRSGHVFTKHNKGPKPPSDTWVRQVACPPNSEGYKQFGAMVDGERKYIKVHEAVMLAFKGPMPEGKDLIMHLNDNKLDNRLSNLAYGTKSENEQAKHQDTAPLPPAIQQIMDDYGVSEATARRAVRILFGEDI